MGSEYIPLHGLLYTPITATKMHSKVNEVPIERPYPA